ncbi:MAG: hypothetical protein AB1861_29760 [Cyanobacteriota bacterium]
MAEHEGTEPRNNLLDGETIPQEPLGIKNPLLPPNPLGQNLLNPKFLHPLGARSINVFNPSAFFSEEMADEFPPDNPFKNSPFFAESQGSQLSEAVDVNPAPSPDAALPVMRATDPTFVQPVLATEPPAQKAAEIYALTAPSATPASEISNAIASSPLPSTIQRAAEIDALTAPIQAPASEITNAIATSPSPSTIQRAAEIGEQTAPIEATGNEVTNAIASSPSPSTIQTPIDALTAPIEAVGTEISNAIASSPSASTIQRAAAIDALTAPGAAPATEISNAIATSPSPSTIQRAAAINEQTAPIEAGTEISNAIATTPSPSTIQRTAGIEASTPGGTPTTERSNESASSPSASTIQRVAAIEASTAPDAAPASEISNEIASSPSASTIQRTAGIEASTPGVTSTTERSNESATTPSASTIQRAAEIDAPTAPIEAAGTEITNAIATTPSSTTLSSVPTKTTATEPRLGQAFLDTESQVQRAPAIEEQIAPNLASAPPDTIASQPTLGQTLSDTEPQVQRALAIEELSSSITAPAPEQMSQVKNPLADSTSPAMPSSVQPDTAAIEPTVEQPLLQAELQQKAQMPQPLIAPQAASVPPETELELTSAVSENLAAVSNLTTYNTLPEVTTDRVVVQPFSETETANNKEATLSNVTEPIESPISFSAVTEAESVEMPAITSEKITVDRSDTTAPVTKVESLVQKAPALSAATEPGEPPLLQKTEAISSEVTDNFASTPSIPTPATASPETTPDISTLVQASLNSQPSDSKTTPVPEALKPFEPVVQLRAEFPSEVSSSPPISTSAIAPKSVREETTPTESTLIQPIGETLSPQAKGEVLPEVLAPISESPLPTELSAKAPEAFNSAISPTESTDSHLHLPESTPISATAIQPKLETEPASESLTGLAQENAIASTNSIQVPGNITTQDARVVQPKLETEPARENLAGLAPEAIASTDSIQVPKSTTTQDATVVQPKLETEPANESLAGLAQENAIASADSIQVPEITSVKNTSAIQARLETEPASEDFTVEAKQAIAFTDAIQVPESTTTPDATVIQPKLEIEPASENLAGLAQDAIASTDAIQVPGSTTTPDVTVIQPKLETAPVSEDLTRLAPESLEESEQLPQLPQVLTNLSILSPLSQQSNLLASSFPDMGSQKVEESFLAPITSNFSPASAQPISIQRMPEESGQKNQEATAFLSSVEQVQMAPSPLSSSPETPPSANSSTNTREIPTSWSSISELLGDNTPKASESIVVQPLSDQRTWDAPQNPIVSKASDYNNSQSNISQPIMNSPQNNSLGNVIQTYSVPSRRTSASGMEALIQLMGDADSQVGAIEQSLSAVDDSSLEEASDNLELLAREVYSFIRQRLEIERERRGNNYSGRLPW